MYALKKALVWAILPCGGFALLLAMGMLVMPGVHSDGAMPYRMITALNVCYFGFTALFFAFFKVTG